LFNKALCYDCHTESAQGDPSIGAPSLMPHAWLFGGSREALVDTISYGRAGICPAWVGRLSPVTIRSIAIYLRSQSEKS
jgi:cytochrome c oxidase cbb3-type subunit 3